jgi:hypothetical protein
LLGSVCADGDGDARLPHPAPFQCSVRLRIQPEWISTNRDE